MDASIAYAGAMVILVMGVAGAGKTTVGRLLAQRLGFRFADADDLHPPENVARMRAGLPLREEDRAPWLAALRRLIDGWLEHGEDAVLACSALRASHRRQLGAGRPGVRLVFLHAPPALLAARLAARKGHFAGPALLESQL